MKYTERFFEFPIRVYDRFTAEQALKKEESINAPDEGEWIQGSVRISYREITVWCDYFDSLQGVAGVELTGFHSTIVWTKNEGIFICTLKKEDFEALLNAHSEKIEAYFDEEDKKNAAALQGATLYLAKSK